MKHYMIDIETLSTGTDAMVLSIALVRFTQDSILDTLLLFPDLSQQNRKDRKIDIDTLTWWMKNRELLNQTLQHPRKTLNFCYHQIKYFLIDRDPQTRIWSKSPSFDLQILNHLFQDWTHPISEFRLEADVRTAELKLHQKEIPLEKSTIPHDPLEDAIAQSKNIQNFLMI